ncbi:hypothetical protein EASAB2608_05198 [Streptomyces sp. EAS-AB2608]|nr:hypothetical protein EASAB2608_05198 [Streptomyces sp. EAS-AB2608]
MTALSKTLHRQMGAISIAVTGVRRGVDKLEKEQRQWFWAIQTGIGKLHPMNQEKQHVSSGTEMRRDDDRRTAHRSRNLRKGPVGWIREAAA